PTHEAVRLGATAGETSDIVLADGTPAWCDGGPRASGAVDGAVVHRYALEAGRVHADQAPAMSAAAASLAPDQQAAVLHPGGRPLRRRRLRPDVPQLPRRLAARRRHRLRRSDLRGRGAAPAGTGRPFDAATRVPSPARRRVPRFAARAPLAVAPRRRARVRHV